jgi:hypothetical protein
MPPFVGARWKMARSEGTTKDSFLKSCPRLFVPLEHFPQSFAARQPLLLGNLIARPP